MTLDPLPPLALAQLAAVTDGAIRVGPLQGLPALLRELGQDPEAVFREAGVDLCLLDDPEGSIGFAALGRLMDRCAVMSGCHHVGLLLGQRTGLAALGIVGMLVEQSPDLGRALANLVLHLHLHDRGAVPVLSVEGPRALLGYAIYQPGVAGTRQIYDAAIAITLNIVRALCGREWRPTAVLFSHDRPKQLLPFERFFRAPMRFDSERTALVFPAEQLERPIRGADPKLRRLLEARIAQLEPTGAGDLLVRMRRVLRNLILGGGGSLDEVARIFSMHRRTLNRRMRQRGLSFQELMEESRYDLARQLLRETEMSASTIAHVLNYSDLSAFSRAFRRWSGTSPTRWRADTAPPPPPGRRGRTGRPRTIVAKCPAPGRLPIDNSQGNGRWIRTGSFHRS